MLVPHTSLGRIPSSAPTHLLCPTYLVSHRTLRTVRDVDRRQRRGVRPLVGGDASQMSRRPPATTGQPAALRGVVDDAWPYDKSCGVLRRWGGKWEVAGNEFSGFIGDNYEMRQTEMIFRLIAKQCNWIVNILVLVITEGRRRWSGSSQLVWIEEVCGLTSACALRWGLNKVSWGNIVLGSDINHEHQHSLPQPSHHMSWFQCV